MEAFTNLDPTEGLSLESVIAAIESVRQDVYFIESEFVPLDDDDGDVMCYAIKTFWGEHVLIVHPQRVQALHEGMPRCFRLNKIDKMPMPSLDKMPFSMPGMFRRGSR